MKNILVEIGKNLVVRILTVTGDVFVDRVYLPTICRLADNIRPKEEVPAIEKRR